MPAPPRLERSRVLLGQTADTGARDVIAAARDLKQWFAESGSGSPADRAAGMNPAARLICHFSLNGLDLLSPPG